MRLLSRLDTAALEPFTVFLDNRLGFVVTPDGLELWQHIICKLAQQLRVCLNDLP